MVALDVASLEAALALVDQIPSVRWWKVGLELFSAVGPRILGELKQRDKLIFLDAKLHDIPNTVGRAAAVAASHRVDRLSVHTLGGRQMLEAAAQAVAGSSCRLLAITVLTSLSSTELTQELNIKLPLQDYVVQLTQLALDCGLKGAVCSPQEVSQLRQHFHTLELVTPGIRPNLTSHQDQARTLTPSAAFAAGSDYLVIGRPITQAPDPAQAFRAICHSLEGVIG